MKKLDRIHCMDAIKNHEFSDDVISAKPYTAIVLTQSWCPQWAWMRDYLKDINRDDTQIWYVEYDHEDFFEVFMEFKEQVWGNHNVPYIRYYRHGTLVKTGNYTGKSGFESTLFGS